MSEDTLITSYKAVLATQAGKDVVFDILSLAHMYSSSMSALGREATAFNEGERNIGIRLLDRLREVGPDEYIKLLNWRKENV